MTSFKSFLYIPTALLVAFTFVFGPLFSNVGVFSQLAPLVAYADGHVEIGTCHELRTAINGVGGLEADYILTASLDCTDAGLLAEDGDTLLVGNDFNFEGVFTGAFDGDGHTITLQFDFENKSDVGLFEAIGAGASVSNLNLEGSIIIVASSGVNNKIGFLAGQVSDATLSNISVSGSIDVTLTEEGSAALRNTGLFAGEIVGNNASADDITVSGTIDILGENNSDATVDSIGGAFGGGYCSAVLTNSTADIAINIDGSFGSGISYVGGFVGLAACEGPGASFDEIHVTGTVLANGTSNSYRIGGVVGEMVGNTISNSSFTGTAEDGPSVSGELRVGGLIGDATNNLVISNSFASGNILGAEFVGGLVGRMSSSEINNSYSTGDVSGEVEVGGFIGRMRSGEVHNSYATGDAHGEDDIGGFVGDMGDSSIVTKSYATGDVFGDEGVLGGFAGFVDFSSEIYNSYARGNVSNLDNNAYSMGGFVGMLEGDVFYSYSTGDVILAEDNEAGEIGGFVGYKADDSIYSSYSVGSIIDHNTDGDMGGFIGRNDFNPGQYNSGYWTGSGPELAIGNQSEAEIAYALADKDAFKDTTLGVYGYDEGVATAEYGILGDDYSGGLWDFENIWGINDVDNDGYPFLRWQGLESEEEEPEPVLGCTDSSATNYNAFATQSDDSCTYRSSRSSGSSGTRVSRATIETPVTTSAPVNQPATTTSVALMNQLRTLIAQYVALGGEVTPAMQAVMNTTEETVSTEIQSVRDLTVGDSGADVTQLQTLLIAEGHDIPAGATGLFFNQTQTALAAYQAENGIAPAAGYFGSITRTQMKAAGLTGLWW